MIENCLNVEFLKKKLAYPYEYLTLSIFQEPLNLTKEDFWPTLKQKSPPQAQIDCTQEIIKTFDTKNGQELTMLYLQMDVLQLAKVFENCAQTSTEEYGINPLYSYSAPGYTWKAGLKIKDLIKDTAKLPSGEELLLLLENNKRGGISCIMGDRDVESDGNTKLSYIDANNLFEWALNQPPPSGGFENIDLDISQSITQEIIEK